MRWPPPAVPTPDARSAERSADREYARPGCWRSGTTKELKQEQEVIKRRLDNIDSLDTVGDLQQRLNAMVRRYAQGKGIAFGLAWKEFRVAFNTAYRTNLKSLVNNYEEKHNLKKLTTPQYLSLVDRLPDAIRVADKMLNKESV